MSLKVTYRAQDHCLPLPCSKRHQAQGFTVHHEAPSQLVVPHLQYYPRHPRDWGKLATVQWNPQHRPNARNNKPTRGISPRYFLSWYLDYPCFRIKCQHTRQTPTKIQDLLTNKQSPYNQYVCSKNSLSILLNLSIRSQQKVVIWSGKHLQAQWSIVPKPLLFQRRHIYLRLNLSNYLCS